VADWYGKMEDGTPFHGSIVRGIDARRSGEHEDHGEALLGGWDARHGVVGDVPVRRNREYPWTTAGNGLARMARSRRRSAATPSSVSVSSVSFAGGNISAVDSYDVPGYGGVLQRHAELHFARFRRDHETSTCSAMAPAPGKASCATSISATRRGAIIERGS